MQHLQPNYFSFLLLMLLAFSSTGAAGQTAVKVWDKALSQPGHNEFVTAIRVKQGGYLIASTWSGTLEAFRSRAYRGGKDISLILTDEAGNQQWAKNFGSLYDETPTALCQTKDGGFMVGGIAGIADYWYNDTVRNISDVSEPFRGKKDMWMLKLDAQGNKQWDRVFGGSEREELSAILPLPDGYLLVGSSESEASGDKSEGSRGNFDFWVVRTDLQGKKLWDKTFGGNKLDKAVSAIATPDGGFLIGGISNSDAGADKTQDTRSKKVDDTNKTNAHVYSSKLGLDFWVVKVNGNGTKLWDRRYGGPGDDNLKAMLLLKDGNVMLGGTTGSGPGGDKMSGQRSDKMWAAESNTDYWLVKIDQNGKQLRENTYGGYFIDEFGSMLETDEGALLLAGHSSSDSNGDKTENAHTSAVWLLKADASGNKLWDKQFIGLHNQYGERVAIMGAGKGTYTFASFSNTGESGDRSQPRQPMQNGEIWLVQIRESSRPLLATGKLIPALCDDQPLEVPFTALGAFRAGNVFTAQLSDAKGRFKKPVTIGSLESNSSGAHTISAIVPAKTKAGKKYRVRVVASEPVVVGTGNGEDLGIGEHFLVLKVAPNTQNKGGVPPFEYSLDGAPFVVKNLYEQLAFAQPGLHTLTMRDARQCTRSATFWKDPDQKTEERHTVARPGTTMVWHKVNVLQQRQSRNRRPAQKVSVEYEFKGKPALLEVYYGTYLAASAKDLKQKSGTLTFDFTVEDGKAEDLVVVITDMNKRSSCTYTIRTVAPKR